MVEAADADRSRGDRSVVDRAGAPAAREEVVGAVVAATGKRGVCPTAKPGVQPKIGNIPPQPMIRYCCTIEKSVDMIQYRNLSLIHI